MDKIYCVSCGKQIVMDWKPSRYNGLVTTHFGAKSAGFGNVFCGYCSEDLDEHGLFPEERRLLDKIELEYE